MKDHKSSNERHAKHFGSQVENVKIDLDIETEILENIDIEPKFDIVPCLMLGILFSRSSQQFLHT